MDIDNLGKAFYNVNMKEEEILENYKKYLIDFHVWKIDASEKKRQIREQDFPSLYSDEELSEVILNSKRFSKKIANELAMKSEYDNGRFSVSMQLPQDAVKYVSNGCSGDYKADVWIFINGHYMNVSLYMLKSFLGEKFSLSIEDEFVERYNKKKKTCTILFKPHLKVSVRPRDLNAFLANKYAPSDEVENEEQMELGL